jgi:hypothetical protein
MYGGNNDFFGISVEAATKYCQIFAKDPYDLPRSDNRQLWMQGCEAQWASANYDAGHPGAT